MIARQDPQILFVDHTSTVGGAELILLDIARYYRDSGTVVPYSRRVHSGNGSKQPGLRFRSCQPRPLYTGFDATRACLLCLLSPVLWVLRGPLLGWPESTISSTPTAKRLLSSPLWPSC